MKKIVIVVSQNCMINHAVIFKKTLIIQYSNAFFYFFLLSIINLIIGVALCSL